MAKLKIDIPQNLLVDFCRRWLINEFALFGSVIRDDFDADSDLDILVTFAPEANWSLLGHFRMEHELANLLKRKVDLFSRRAVEQNHNWMRRREILNTARTIYVS